MMTRDAGRALPIPTREEVHGRFGGAHDVTLSTLDELMTSLPAKGLVLAPLTEVARRAKP